MYSDHCFNVPPNATSKYRPFLIYLQFTCVNMYVIHPVNTHAHDDMFFLPYIFKKFSFPNFWHP